jgi:signal transduction histidine kinase/HPt (histidine-containing phosphotransfer) domain-containing protein/ActR/RegA family two-component response regulator
MPHQSTEECQSTEITVSHGVTERCSVGPQPNSHMMEATMAASQTAGRARWHYVCLALTALNTVAFFWTSQTSINSFTDDARVNRQWDQQQAKYVRLSNLIGAMSERGGRVFNSRNIEREQLQFEGVTETLRQELNMARRDAGLHMSVVNSVAIFRQLDEIGLHAITAASSADQLFEQMRRSRREEAVDHLIQLNQACSSMTADVTELHRLIRDIQDANSDQQMSHATVMRSRQFWLGSCGLLMVSLVAWRGSRLTRSVRDSMESARQQTDALADEQARLSTVFDEAADGIVTVISRDISQRKEFEAELHEARIEAESATKVKSQFLANMSHEIRTPMTAIIGYSDLLLDPNQRPDERTRCVKTIRRNAGHLLTLINDILDLSKIEANRMNVESIECSPCQIVSDVASLMRVRAIEKKIDFGVVYDGPVPQTIVSDSVRIRQLLINLVGNSIKFTKDGEVRIHVWTEGAESESPILHFKVLDTGIGMTPEQIGRLFRPFTQADDSTTRQFGGTGLGLTICRRLVELLGGEIEVTSAPGQGSSFEFHVPTGSLAGVTMIASPSESTLCEDIAPMQSSVQARIAANILLAEDGGDNRQLISHHLRTAGATVTTAVNGKVAYDMALRAADQGQPFDMIFMDMQMPVMDGYEATAALREKGYDAPIVALTAHAMSGDRDRCISAGCNDYSTKPINPRKLTDMVCKFVPQPEPTQPLAVAGTIVETAMKEPDETIDCEVTTRTCEPLISEFCDDPEMLEIVGRFIDGLVNHVESLTNALARSDFETIYQTAHKLSGAAGGYGYPAVSEQGLIVEQLAKAGGPIEELESHLEELVHLCQRVIAGRGRMQTDDRPNIQPTGVDLLPLSEPVDSTNSCALPGEHEPPRHDGSAVHAEARVDRIVSQIECLSRSDPDWKELTDTLESLACVVRDSLQNSRESEVGVT